MFMEFVVEQFPMPLLSPKQSPILHSYVCPCILSPGEISELWNANFEKRFCHVLWKQISFLPLTLTEVSYIPVGHF